MPFVRAIKNFRSFLWGKVILELFTITHPHVKLNKTNQAIDCAYEMFPGHFEKKKKKLL